MANAVRSSMTDIIAKVRQLIADPIPAQPGFSPVFADADVQDALDERRRDVYLTILKDQPTIAGPSGSTPGGLVSWLDYFSDGGWWEADVFVQDYTYKTVDGTTTPTALATGYPDLVVGHWKFVSTLPSGLLPPVFVTGKQHDPYGAAADLLEAWMAKVKLQFDFLSSGRTFKAHQQIAGLSTLIDHYRRRQRVTISEMVRADTFNR